MRGASITVHRAPDPQGDTSTSWGEAQFLCKGTMFLCTVHGNGANHEENGATAHKTAAIPLDVFQNKFVFGEYVHVHSVVLKVWSVKCSTITK